MVPNRATHHIFHGLYKVEDERMLKVNKENTGRCAKFVQSRQ